MKVMTEKQQLAKIKDELFEASQIQQSDINDLERKIRDYEDSWWASKRNKARLLKYELKNMKRVREFLSDYYSCISDRYETIVKEEKALSNLPV